MFMNWWIFLLLKPVFIHIFLFVYSCVSLSCLFITPDRSRTGAPASHAAIWGEDAVRAGGNSNGQRCQPRARRPLHQEPTPQRPHRQSDVINAANKGEQKEVIKYIIVTNLVISQLFCILKIHANEQKDENVKLTSHFASQNYCKWMNWILVMLSLKKI